MESDIGGSDAPRVMVPVEQKDAINKRFLALIIDDSSGWKVSYIARGIVKSPTYKTDTWGTLYDGVGSVKRHLGFTIREGSSFFSPKRIFSLSSSFISTKARFVNRAVESDSTNHLFGLP